MTSKELINKLLSGDETVRDEITNIDSDINSATEKLEKLITL